MYYLDLMEKIEKEEGFKIPGMEPRSNMTAHLSNDYRVVRVKRGIYGLKKWEKKEDPGSRTEKSGS